jgi:hypothetical protein
MRFAISCLIALVAALATVHYAHAGQRVLQVDQHNLVRLYDSPCVHGGTLALIQPQARSKMKKAEVTLAGERLYACWTEDPEGDPMILLEDGRQAGFYMRNFKDEPGV